MSKGVPAEYAGERTVAAALNLMVDALAILDEREVPSDIGAHLDLAIERLRQFVGQSSGALN